MTNSRPAIVAVLATTLVLSAFGAASASPEAVPDVARLIDPSPPRRGMPGARDTMLSTRPFRVEGSPYEWTVEASQHRDGPGVPPADPRLRIVAFRRSTSGSAPVQVHAWEFTLSAGALQFDGELRHVGLDTGLIPAFGAIFMDLEDLSAMSTSKLRCSASGDVLSKRSTRTGVLRGSMTFFPGYDDPQMPDDVNITHVRARIDRAIHTGNDCRYPRRCSPETALISTQTTGPGLGYLVNAGTGGRGEGPAFLFFQQYEIVGVATVMHLVAAFGQDVIVASSSSVEVRSDVAAPFVAPGGTMSWGKGTKTVDLTRRCRRTEWLLTMPSGSFDLRLDSGSQTIVAPTDAAYQVEMRRS